MGRTFLDLLRLNRQFAAGIVLLSLVTLFALLSFVSPYPTSCRPTCRRRGATSWARRRAARTFSGC
jgi:hypothetical protein